LTGLFPQSGFHLFGINHLVGKRSILRLTHEAALPLPVRG
jgi:hypothetical protein